MKNIIIMLGEIMLGVIIFGLLTGDVQTEIENIMDDVVEELQNLDGDDSGSALPSVNYFKALEA